MTDIGPSIPHDRQLDAADIRYLFDRLSSHLREAARPATTSWSPEAPP